MSNVYAVEDDDNPRAKKPLKGQQHDFWFNRETRRMVCEKCGGLMNECPPICPGKGILF